MQLSKAQRGALNSAARNRAHMRRTGTTYAGQRLWSPDELEALRAHRGDVAGQIRAIPTRTPKAIEMKRKRMGLVKPLRVWSERQVRTMKPPYVDGAPVSGIAALTYKTNRQVWAKAARCRLRRPKKPPKIVGIPLYDKIRRRAFDLHLSMRDLAEMTGSRSYFHGGSAIINWKAVLRAVDNLDGELVVRWSVK